MENNENMNSVIEGDCELTKLSDEQVLDVIGGNSIEDALKIGASPFEDVDRTDTKDIDQKVRDSI